MCINATNGVPDIDQVSFPSLEITKNEPMKVWVPYIDQVSFPSLEITKNEPMKVWSDVDIDQVSFPSVDITKDEPLNRQLHQEQIHVLCHISLQSTPDAT